ncbi:DUF2061 domain-containing protein [uncultured Nonlabens sp.]|uniref:DUF2061 domain-containing protein n=1 Tax=uncultured Nonlabens sp. TaxID=859306 RepID=UPI0026290577|nr:DUF2061 domain-containing protein [uncultured Nonlabens sp.]
MKVPLILDRIYKPGFFDNQQSSDPNWKIALLKTISWRVIGTIDTIVISWFLTSKIDIALTIGGVEVFSKMALYFIHERLWSKITNLNNEKNKQTVRTKV